MGASPVFGSLRTLFYRRAMTSKPTNTLATVLEGLRIDKTLAKVW